MIKLLLKTPEESRELTFQENEISLGRSSENTLAIPDKKISRRHAKIEKVGSEYKVLDLGSGNGIRLNGHEVSSRALAKGDEIRLGLTSIFVLDLDTPAIPATAAPLAMLPVATLAPPPSTAGPAPQVPAASAVPATAPDEDRTLDAPRPRLTRRNVYQGPSSSKLVSMAAVVCIVAALTWAGVAYKDEIFPSTKPSGEIARKPLRKDSDAKKAKDELARFEAEVAKAERISDPMLEEARELHDTYGDTERQFAALLFEVRERHAQQTARVTLADVEKRVADALRDKKYSDALESLKPLQKTNDTTALATLLQKVLEDIYKDYSAVMEEGKKLEWEKKYPAAGDHYRAHAPRFSGTEYHKRLLNKPEDLDLVARAERDLSTKAFAAKPAPENPIARVTPKEEPAPEPVKPVVVPEVPKPATPEPPKPAPKMAPEKPKVTPEPPKPAPKKPEPPKPEPAKPAAEAGAAKGPVKKPDVLCDVKRTAKGNFCMKCDRTLEPDDLRKGACKRCEEKPKKIDMCVKLFFQAECHPEKIDDKPVFC